MEATPATRDFAAGSLASTRSLGDEMFKDTLGLGEAVPGEQQFLHPLPIPAPLLNLIEVAPVGVERVVCSFMGPVVWHLMPNASGNRLIEGLSCPGSGAPLWLAQKPK
jgi:hypothetical protein